MDRHIVLYRRKDRSEESRKALKDRFLPRKGQVPQIRALEVGIDDLIPPRSYDVALNLTLDSKQDLTAYKAHPFHAGVSEYVHEGIESSVSCNFEV